MTWLAILVLTCAAFAAAAWLFRLPRQLWTLTGAALCLGLSGYALQGAPELPSHPTPPQTLSATGGEEGVIALRRAMFGAPVPPSRYVMVADGFARRGDHAEAAAFLRNAVLDNPGDAEAWVALAIAVEAYADGVPTPASRHAFARARAAAPQSPAPAYFEALGYLRSGSFVEARDSLAEAVARTPDDAPYRPDFLWQLSRLDLLLERMEAMRGRAPGTAPPVTSPQSEAVPAAKLRGAGLPAIGAFLPGAGKRGEGAFAAHRAAMEAVLL